jgi:hypothetical protein
MTQGIVLLSKDSFYLTNSGELPLRPTWDKQFITELIRGKVVLCSFATLRSLPSSMFAVASFTTDVNAKYDINFGIDTFKTARPDQLLVVRSLKDMGDGKKFNLRNWHNIYKSKELEIYV